MRNVIGGVRILKDVAITSDGDLLLDGTTKDFCTVEEDDLRSQAALCRIKSIKKDWFIDNIGSDLESILGEPNNDTIRKYAADKIFEALTVDNLFEAHEVFIEASSSDPKSFNLEIYLKNLRNNKSTLITLELDLVKGVNVRIGE